MTQIHHFCVDKGNIYVSIVNLESVISEITDGLDSMYKCKITRTNRFEVDQIAAVIEITAVVKSHTVRQGVYYILGSSD